MVLLMSPLDRRPNLPSVRLSVTTLLAIIMRIRNRIIVSGYVQGVGFRVACRRAAGEARVDGWVRNLPDGRVEAVAEGAPEAVQRFVEWCRRGPVGAEVAAIEVVSEVPQDQNGFEIIR
jgi:acylphosphatase